MVAIAKKLHRKKALIIIAVCALILLLLIIIRGAGHDKTKLTTVEDRQAYLAERGWTVDPYSEECRRVQIPDCSDGVMLEYNRLQQSQGFDLSEHSGEICIQYNYVVTNYTGYDQTVYATLYLQNGRVIAGDIHTAAINGFMHGLERGAEE